MTLEQLCEIGYDLASKVLITTKEQLFSSFTLAKEDGSVDVIHCPWADDAEKRETILTIGRTVVTMKEEVTAYCMLSEVWLSHYQPGEAKRGRPEHDPKRREGVVCLASDGKEHVFRAWEIGRDQSGCCVSLTYTESPGRYESWMVEALDRALEMQRLKRKIVDEYKAGGDPSALEGLPRGVKEAIKKFINSDGTAGRG